MRKCQKKEGKNFPSFLPPIPAQIKKRVFVFVFLKETALFAAVAASHIVRGCLLAVGALVTVPVFVLLHSSSSSSQGAGQLGSALQVGNFSPSSAQQKLHSEHFIFTPPLPYNPKSADSPRNFHKQECHRLYRTKGHQSNDTSFYHPHFLDFYRLI